MLIPDVIRGLAGRVIEACVVEWGGAGGFVTEGFANMVNHVTAPNANLLLPYREPGHRPWSSADQANVLSSRLSPIYLVRHSHRQQYSWRP